MFIFVLMSEKVKNIIKAPTSKSILQRVLFLSLLSETKIILQNTTWCDDTIAVKNILTDLNVLITEKNNTTTIDASNVKFNKQIFNLGESGFAARIFSIYFALFNKRITLNGKGTLLNRNLSSIKTILKKLNVNTELNSNKLPLKIKGRITPQNIEIDASDSSQLLSGLLMVLPKLNADITIKVNNLKSKPYIDLTLNILTDFGVNITNINHKEFKISNKQKYNPPKKYNIEGDWSGAAFFCVYGAVAQEIEIDNLYKDSHQADKKILEVLKTVGAKVILRKNSIIVSPKELNAFNFDASHSPDLFPPLVCLAVFCKGTSTINGVSRLFNKESNRAEVLQTEFKKVNINIKINNNKMFINTDNITTGEIDSNNDHRIAMAAAMISVMSNTKIKIKNKDCVNKSYPDFFNDLSKISGFDF